MAGRIPSNKRVYRQTEAQNLREAVEWLREDPSRSLRAASKTFGIYRNKLSAAMVDDSTPTRPPGRPNILTDDQEQRLKVYILERASRNMGIGKLAIQQKACNIAKATGRDLFIANRKGENKENLPALGKTWFKSFVKRHRIKMKKPQGLCGKRYAAFSQDVKDDFFNMYKKVIFKLGFQDKPERIWNYDEKCQRFVHRPDKIAAGIGQNVDSVVSGNRESFTVVLMCNAAGTLLPPMIIVKGETHRSVNKWKTKDFAEAYWTYQSKGYNTASVMSGYMEKVVIPGLGEERPHLLVSDGFGSHEDVDVLEQAIDNDLVMFNLPSHTTSKIQPLDKYVMATWNKKWNSLCSVYTADNPDQPIDYQTAPAILKQCYESISKYCIKKSFKDSGLFPIDSEVVAADELPMVEEMEVITNNDCPVPAIQLDLMTPTLEPLVSPSSSVVSSVATPTVAMEVPINIVNSHESVVHKTPDELVIHCNGNILEITSTDSPKSTVQPASPSLSMCSPISSIIQSSELTPVSKFLSLLTDQQQTPLPELNEDPQVTSTTLEKEPVPEQTTPIPSSSNDVRCADNASQLEADLTPVSKQLQFPNINTERCQNLRAKRQLYTKPRIVTGQEFYEEKLKKQEDKAKKAEEKEQRRRDRIKKKEETSEKKPKNTSKRKGRLVKEPVESSDEEYSVGRPKRKASAKGKNKQKAKKRKTRRTYESESSGDEDLDEIVACQICDEWDCPNGDSDDDDDWVQCDNCEAWLHALCCDCGQACPLCKHTV